MEGVCDEFLWVDLETIMFEHAVSSKYFGDPSKSIGVLVITRPLLEVTVFAESHSAHGMRR